LLIQPETTRKKNEIEYINGASKPNHNFFPHRESHEEKGISKLTKPTNEIKNKLEPKPSLKQEVVPEENKPEDKKDKKKDDNCLIN